MDNRKKLKQKSMEKREKKPYGFWTKEECYRAASECGSRNEFRKNCGGGYYAALKNNWIEGYYWFKEIKKPKGYWTKEKCYEEARECGSLNEFRKNCESGYQAACINKWLDDYDWLEKKKKPSGYWTKERCYEEARKYGSRIEFHKNCGSGYGVARRNGWLRDYWWFERQQNPFTDKMDNVYCYYFTEFNSVYVGRTINIQERDYCHRIRGTVCNFARKNKTDVPEMVLLETNLSLEDGLKLEDYYIKKFKKEGWSVLNKAKTGKGCGSLGRLGRRKWTKEKCYEEARKCKTRSEFAKICCSGYNVARKNGWLGDYYWFEEKCKHSGYWTKEKCYEAACECKTRSEFEKKCKGGYDAARKNNWLENYYWFEDGRKLASQKRTIWTKEKCSEEARKYNTRSEFAKKCGGGYNVALKNGWLDNYFWFEEKIKPSGYWTKEQCYEVSRECKNRKEFEKKYWSAYNVARKNKWLDEIFPKNKKSA